MKAMILAAGRGERMRPITDERPKALLEAGGKPLIVWHIERLVRAGFRDIVINHAHLGPMIEAVLGDGSGYGADIRYSPETDALETAGGIANALPLLGEAPFLVINADVYCELDFSELVPKLGEMAQRPEALLAYLVLVDNPEHHRQGDFSLDGGRVALSGEPMLTFSGIGLYRPELFGGISRGAKAKLAPLLREAIRRGAVAGEHFRGRWVDVGTPQRLRDLNDVLSAGSSR